MGPLSQARASTPLPVDGRGALVQDGRVSESPARLALPRALTEVGALVELPDKDADELIPVIEVLLQEGLKVLSLPSSAPDTVREMYRFRATLGAHAVITPTDAQSVIDAHAAFAICTFPEPGVVDILSAAGIPVLVDGLTPSEVHAAWAQGPAAVRVNPAEVLGNDYPSALTAMVPGACLVAAVDDAAAVRAWLKAGAQGVSLGHGLLSRVFLSKDYATLRRRVGEFTAALAVRH